MDNTGPLVETTTGNKRILVIHGYYSKWIKLSPLICYMSRDMTKVLVKKFITRYRICDQIHSDQELEFDSHLLKEVCCLWRVIKTQTSPFAPWNNGVVEWSNKLVKQVQFNLDPTYSVVTKLSKLRS